MWNAVWAPGRKLPLVSEVGFLGSASGTWAALVNRDAGAQRSSAGYSVLGSPCRSQCSSTGHRWNCRARGLDKGMPRQRRGLVGEVMSVLRPKDEREKG